ncbi:DNA methyltransferase [Bradyrhizobium pachyrhizi]|uniref:DNA methyltransferase n=1 Tax=Bradyrhizobium pachyrhizi TaxID=280333 RepID=UPI0009E4AC16|nr:DNA methyltransferase [Bradyrhizobium pachyrhizi]
MLALGGAALSSPKQTTFERQSSLFPYYAGFSQKFVRDVLDALEVVSGQVVLDPWNGSGTTTSVANGAGLTAVGIDINPAMAVVAKARLATPGDVNAARQLLKQCSRRLSQAFLREACDSPYESATQSMLLLATFRLTRRKLRERDLIATNPTWWHLGQSDVSSAIASITRTQLDAELVELRSKVSIANGGNNEVSLVRGDLLSENLPQIKADVIITSPPYLTRIDYVTPDSRMEPNC